MQNLLFVVVVVLVCLVVCACTWRVLHGTGGGVGVEGITNVLHSDVSALPP